MNTNKLNTTISLLKNIKREAIFFQVHESEGKALYL